MKFLVNIKGIDIEETNLESLMILKNQLKIVDDGYQELNIDTPEWVLDKLLAATSEINTRTRAELQRQLRAEEARVAALTPRDERLKDAKARVEALKAKLA